MTLQAPYRERVQQLAVGFEPTDAVAGGRPRWPVRLDIEIPDGVPRTVAGGYRHYSRPDDRLPKIDRHDSGLYKLRYLQRHPLPADAIVRLYDERQRYVPRRLRFSIPAPEQTWDDVKPRPPRRLSPLLFPANAYPVSEHCMGLRGRVLRNGAAMPWAWVDAFYLIQTGTDDDPQFLRQGRIGRAISDRHGEFLLLLRPLPEVDTGVPNLQQPVWVNVVINGPSPAPLEPANNRDPLWAVPVETAPAFGMPDPAADDAYLPDGYQADLSADANRNIAFRLGGLLTGVDVPDFIFSLP